MFTMMNEGISTCVDIICRNFKNNKTIEALHFATFNGYELLQDRINVTDEIKDCFDFALKFRETYNLPFWDGFNLSLFNKNFSDYSFLQEIKYHNGKSEIFTVDTSNLSAFMSQLPTQKYLTINSKVKTFNGISKHFILLDFHIPVNPHNQEICKQLLICLNIKGSLLISGKSYHFYSYELYTEEELLGILSTALLYSPIIDRAWIAHQLIERSCCLRISPKYNHLPYLVEEIN